MDVCEGGLWIGGARQVLLDAHVLGLPPRHAAVTLLRGLLDGGRLDGALLGHVLCLGDGAQLQLAQEGVALSDDDKVTVETKNKKGGIDRSTLLTTWSVRAMIKREVTYTRTQTAPSLHSPTRLLY